MHQMRVIARLLALAAALMLALPASALPRTQYYCRWMGEVMTSCCCKGHDAVAPSAQTEFRKAGCCELVTSSGDATTAARDPGVQVPVVALVAILQREQFVGYASSAAVGPQPARGPPAIGPPVFLANCTLLI